MNSIPPRPLSARRQVVHHTTTFEKNMNDFLSTPIHLDPEPTKIPHEKNQRRPHTNRSNRRPVSAIERACNSNDYIFASRRAFEITHKQKADLLIKQSNKNWQDDQRYYDLLTRKQHKKLQKKLEDNDRGVIEDIVERRNDYYLSTLKEQGPIGHFSNKCTMRTVPKDMRPYSRATHPMFE